MRFGPGTSAISTHLHRALRSSPHSQHHVFISTVPPARCWVDGVLQEIHSVSLQQTLDLGPTRNQRAAGSPNSCHHVLVQLLQLVSSVCHLCCRRVNTGMKTFMPFVVTLPELCSNLRGNANPI
jgi:hypothetical protein